ncbi:class I SAM-dependent methyltransferase [Mycobacterium sp.]|uniref:class I SAM-dependent methyltransferase n=1 Tax=Mycobacterium sp. TaxID=1785 RepID=UPI003A8B215C
MTGAPPYVETLRRRSAQRIMRPAERTRERARGLGGYVGKGESVLDVGCGTGRFSAYLREMYGVAPTGIDVLDSRLAEVADIDFEELDFEEFDGTSIPFPDNSFDHVVVNEVLHHSRDPVRLIAECARVGRRHVMVFAAVPDGFLGKVALYARVRASADSRRYPFRPARTAEYREALAWLGSTAAHVTRIPQPADSAVGYQRVLFVYELTP